MSKSTLAVTADDIEFFSGLLERLDLPLDRAAERLERLTQREREVLQLRGPYRDGVPTTTQRDVGAKLEPPISKGRVSELERRALRRLRMRFPRTPSAGELSSTTREYLSILKLHTPEEVANLTESELQLRLYEAEIAARRKSRRQFEASQLEEIKAWLGHSGLSLRADPLAGLPARTSIELQLAKLTTLEAVARLTEEGFLASTYRAGGKILKDVKAWLAQHGRSFSKY